MRPTAEDLELLLSTNDVEPPKQLEEMDEETQRQLAELNTGSVALVYETKGEGEGKILNVENMEIYKKSDLKDNPEADFLKMSSKMSRSNEQFK